MNMKSLISGGLTAVVSSGLFLTLALTTIAPASAVPQPSVAQAGAERHVAAERGNNYQCWEFATWKTSLGTTGVNPLIPPMAGPMSLYLPGTLTTPGGEPVSGATIEAAASDCHAKTRAHFKADTKWAMSNYNALCSSTFKPGQSGTITVYAIDRFREIAENPQRYNKVAGYVVTCGNSVTPDNALQGGILPF